MQTVYKYGTGQSVPHGAKYLSTEVEEIVTPESRVEMDGSMTKERFVWHYFLVEIDPRTSKPFD